MLVAKVRRTLRERGLVSRGDHVLVACSGGPDSTALLHVLHRLRNELGVTLSVASIDHGLRPESRQEVEQVHAFSKSLGLPFHSARVEVPAPSASLQATAREVRYGTRLDIAAAHGAGRIAVGHTQDDQAETVLARVLRGAGLRGLAGIAAQRADGIIRPLIDSRRSEVEAHCVSHALPFIRDPSNHQRTFERVRIREEVLPVLAAEDPRVVEHLCALGDEAAAVDAYLDTQLPEPPPRGQRTVSIDEISPLPPPLRVRWLRRWIARETGLTLHRSHLVSADRLLTGQGEVLLGSGWAVCRHGGGLSLEHHEHRRTRSNRS